jgi:hypothetical protein
VEFLQLGAGATFFVALEYLDVVFELELLEEPDDSLRARLLEPVDVLDRALQYVWEACNSRGIRGWKMKVG